MTSRIVDLETWPRAAQFHFFRTYQQPHYATTTRLDVTHLIGRKADGVSPYRASLYAIGAGLHAVPELCMRFRGDEVVAHDMVTLSMTVPTAAGSFGYAYVRFVQAGRRTSNVFEPPSRFQPDAKKAGTGT